MVQTADEKRTRTGAVTSAVNIPLKVLDGGNRFLAWLDNDGNYRQVPSVFLELEDHQEDPNLSHDSVLLNFGDNRRYLVGQAAKEMGGKPIFLDSKTDKLWLLVAAVLEPLSGSLVGVDKLRVLCPNSANGEFKEAAKSIESLEWLWSNRSYQRNGQDVLVSSIRKVELIDEGIPAWKYAKANNLLLDPTRNVMVVDAGGGDTTIRVITPSGTVDRALDAIAPGTQSLAHKIRTALNSQFKFSPDLGEIMDAIATGTFSLDNGFTLVDFRSQFDRALIKWLDEISSAINGILEQPGNGSRIGQIVICGGSAPLFASKEKPDGRIKVLRHDAINGLWQKVNTLGMTL